MTEKEWLTCNDPRKLAEPLRRSASDRNNRLFACAFWQWESIAKSQCELNLSQALHYAESWAETGTRPPLPFPEGFGWHPLLANYASDATNWTIRNKRGFITTDPDRAAESQVAFLRDIFGNPFRPITVDPAWLTSTVLALAQGIYDDRAFDRMPILADALQDAGCDNDDILTHCRGTGPHVRGCWVVDLVLGKV
jgi:hypothetical protein